MTIPRFVDLHVHFRDPGFTQKESLRTGLATARAGGFGAVVAMANTFPVISSFEAACANMERAKKVQEGVANPVRLTQAVSITEGFDGRSTRHLRALKKEVTPIISEDGRDVANALVMTEAMSIAAQKGLIVACHCEDEALAKSAKELRKKFLESLESAPEPFKKAFMALCKGEGVGQIVTDSEEWEAFVAPLKKANELLREAEDVATARNIELAKKTGAHLHLCHVSTKKSVELARAAKAAGVALTAEVTPHHLALTAEGVNILALVNPPLRAQEDCDALIDALRDGVLDCVSSDHAPHTATDKALGSPGFVGLEVSFPVVNTVLTNYGLNFDKVVDLMSRAPARILGLGEAELGYIEVDERKAVVIDSKNFLSKGRATPFNGLKFFGKVVGVK